MEDSISAFRCQIETYHFRLAYPPPYLLPWLDADDDPFPSLDLPFLNTDVLEDDFFSAIYK